MYEFLWTAFVSEFITSSGGDLYRFSKYSETAFLKPFEVAVTDKNPLEHASLHEFLSAAVVSEFYSSSDGDFYRIANYSEFVPSGHLGSQWRTRIRWTMPACTSSC